MNLKTNSYPTHIVNLHKKCLSVFVILVCINKGWLESTEEEREEDTINESVDTSWTKPWIGRVNHVHDTREQKVQTATAGDTQVAESRHSRLHHWLEILRTDSSEVALGVRTSAMNENNIEFGRREIWSTHDVDH